MNRRDELLRMINADISLDASVEVLLDTDLLMTGLVDSLGVIEVVAWLEDRFEIEIDVMDVVLENFQTATQMLALVDRLLQPASTP